MRLRPIIPSHVNLQPAYLANWGGRTVKLTSSKNSLSKLLFLPPSTCSSKSGSRILFLALAKYEILLNSLQFAVTIYPSFPTLGVREISRELKTAFWMRRWPCICSPTPYPKDCRRIPNKGRNSRTLELE